MNVIGSLLHQKMAVKTFKPKEYGFKRINSSQYHYHYSFISEAFNMSIEHTMSYLTSLHFMKQNKSDKTVKEMFTPKKGQHTVIIKLNQTACAAQSSEF